jgi:hypothetical protein
MKPWQFGHKTPGFGISRQFYMTVLAGTAQLPTMKQVVNPKGESGAIAGFGVPLAASSTKEDLTRPLVRGVYGIASRDRKTVLKLMVMPKEEAGFLPESYLNSPDGLALPAEHRARISSTWTLLQFTFETHDPMVYPSLHFLMAVLRRLAELTEGIISDPVGRVYVLPDELEHIPKADARIDARDYVQIKHKPDRSWVHTLGLQKFSLPEVEIFGVPEGMWPTADTFLFGIAQGQLTGNLLSIGGAIGSRKCAFQVAQGGLDRAQWEGIACYELIPPPGSSAADALLAWSEESKR